MEMSQIGLPKWDPAAFCRFLRIVIENLLLSFFVGLEM